MRAAQAGRAAHALLLLVTPQLLAIDASVCVDHVTPHPPDLYLYLGGGLQDLLGIGPLFWVTVSGSPGSDALGREPVGDRLIGVTAQP